MFDGTSMFGRKQVAAVEAQVLTERCWLFFRPLLG